MIVDYFDISPRRPRLTNFHSREREEYFHTFKHQSFVQPTTAIKTRHRRLFSRILYYAVCPVCCWLAALLLLLTYSQNTAKNNNDRRRGQRRPAFWLCLFIIIMFREDNVEFKKLKAALKNKYWAISESSKEWCVRTSLSSLAGIKYVFFRFFLLFIPFHHCSYSTFVLWLAVKIYTSIYTL